jgi:hypothetical protein
MTAMHRCKPSAAAVALAVAVDNLLAAHLARVHVVDGGTSVEYTSKRLPLGMSRRAFNHRCKQLAELGDGRVCRRGRQWVATRDAIDEKPARRRSPVKVFAGAWSPHGALEAAGIRAQRK